MILVSAGVDMTEVDTDLLQALVRVVHAALQVLQQVVHLLDLCLRVSHTLHHVLQLHHTLICVFLKTNAIKSHISV